MRKKLLYTNNVAHVLWNSITSRPFCVKMVLDKAVISPMLSCVHFDGLL